MLYVYVFTGTIARVKGDIVDRYIAVGSIRAPRALEEYVEVSPLEHVRLAVVPGRSLVIVQLPDRYRRVEAFAHRLYEYSQYPCQKNEISYIYYRHQLYRYT